MKTCQRCGGYGGWWARELRDAVAWEIRPDEDEDGVGYAICGCGQEPDRAAVYSITLIEQPWWIRAWRWTGLDWVGCIIIAFLTLIPGLFLDQPLLIALWFLVLTFQVAEHRHQQRGPT
jgi:hypothetical protein